ncbi:arf-GAP with Rho-GAP domain, ANK repeat and PH domain-containing protein 1 isoform X3, partial [Gallus gallus]|uniref:arf-GAP with Rho-GAP domain, ANK repeat and PH domain-containing protein 1 isoform X3 n=1 Tax=Gallus gallus TaxID=9031 RepID=UPI001AEA7A2D
MSDPTEDCASLPVSSWLAALHLDQYSATFRQHRFRTASDCRTITEADLTRLGVLLPAHRRRILLSLPPLPMKTPPPPPPPPDFDDSDYEDHCSPGTTPQAAVGRQQRLCSASSEEELPGDGQETHVGPTDPSADPTELLCTPIWAGWLDKMAPQGHYRYQRRWVTLDPQYLRYFDSDKDVFSKRFIPISSISRVAPIGEQKVEVLTQHRAFVFRADSDAERSQWLRVLQRAVAEQQERPPAPHVAPRRPPPRPTPLPPPMTPL